MALDIALLAILGGIASILTPCNLLMLPSFIGMMYIKAKNKMESIKATLAYGIGYIVIYITVGLALLFVSGFILHQYLIKFIGDTLLILIGVRLLVFGTQKIFKKKSEKIPEKPVIASRSYQNPYNKKKSSQKKTQVQIKEEKTEELIDKGEDSSEIPEKRFYPTFLILGLSHGSAGFACASAIFTSVILAISTNGTIGFGFIMLLLYCIGIITVLFVIAIVIGQINEILILKIRKYMSKIERILGLIIIIFGMINISSTINILW